MKTLITLAMLSAAGTAFAGFTQDDAAGWLVKNEDGSYVNSSSTTLTQNADGSLTLALNDGASWVGSLLSSDRAYCTFTLAVTLDFGALSVSEAEALFTLNPSTAVGIGVGIDNKLYGVWDTNPTWTTTQQGKTYPTLDYSSFTGEQTVLFTFLGASGSRFYQDSAVYWTGNGLCGHTLGTADILTISSTAADALVSVVGWAEACTGSASDTANATAAFSTAQNLVIPEPSAFGLLAGVGALAFVAARRRRRAK